MTQRGRVPNLRVCHITGCTARAERWHKDGPYQGLGLCMAHYESIREQAVAEVLADPEIRALLGLPPVDKT